MTALVLFREFSEEKRKSLGGHVGYDVACGNRMPEQTSEALSMLIEVIIGEKPSGDYAAVMARFEKGLHERIVAGENVTDFNLTVSPYIPGRGNCPLPVKEPE